MSYAILLKNVITLLYQNIIENVKNIIVLKGGSSNEREVSLSSGEEVEIALSQLNFKYSSIDVMSLQDISSLNPEKDFAFIALHGGQGENGEIQSTLSMMNIPYTHSPPAACAIAMNKVIAKNIMLSIGINTPKSYKITSSNRRNLQQFFRGPFVVKPIDGGSSIGIFTSDNLPENNILENYIAEEYIPGHELQVGVLNDEAIGVIEIVQDGMICSYNHKYIQNKSITIMPPRVSNNVINLAMQQAYLLHLHLGCKSVSRSDFRYNNKTNELKMLEINTHPGLTKTSFLPKICFHYKNMNMKEIVKQIIEYNLI